MKRTIALFVILALTASAAVVLAQRPQPRAAPGAMAKPEMCPDLIEKITKELNLTPDQVTQLQAIRKDFMDSTQATRDQIKTDMTKMRDLWLADTPDAAAIKALAMEMDTLRAQVRDSAIDHAIQALAVLTPDQRAKVKEWVQKNPHLMMGMGCGVCCGAGMRCPMMGGRAAAPVGSGPAVSPTTVSPCCPCMTR